MTFWAGTRRRPGERAEPVACEGHVATCAAPPPRLLAALTAQAACAPYSPGGGPAHMHNDARATVLRNATDVVLQGGEGKVGWLRAATTTCMYETMAAALIVPIGAVSRLCIKCIARQQGPRLGHIESLPGCTGSLRGAGRCPQGRASGPTARGCWRRLPQLVRTAESGLWAPRRSRPQRRALQRRTRTLQAGAAALS